MRYHPFISKSQMNPGWEDENESSDNMANIAKLRGGGDRETHADNDPVSIQRTVPDPSD